MGQNWTVFGNFLTKKQNKNGIEDIYRKLLSDKLPADLGYLYENRIPYGLLYSFDAPEDVLRFVEAVKETGREKESH